MMPLSVRFAAVMTFATLACGPMTEDDALSAGATCANAKGVGTEGIDPFKELVIVDDAVMSDVAARNDSGGPFSFRHAMETLGGWTDPSQVTLGWLDQWAPASVGCRWLLARAENGCDATCVRCDERRLDLSHAPFRLIAITNRIDLSVPTGVGSGEGRLVFSVTEGPGDDPQSVPLPITAIFEFRLAGDRAEWASRWHALGTHRLFDAGYIRALGDVTEGFVRATDLAQIRINDAVTGNRAVMHEFHLDANALDPARRLIRAGLRRTPSHSDDGNAQLRDFLNANKEEIFADRYELPSSMLTTRVEIGETWKLPGVEEALRHAFAGNTCDGCHGPEHPTTDGGFHISPLVRGPAKLSRFLFDPEHRGDDELTRRAEVLARFSCARE